MKATIKTVTSIVIVILSCTTQSFSQTPKGEQQRNKIQVAVDSILNSPFKSNLLKDSVAIYALNFRLDVLKGKNGVITVGHPIANDSLAYELFPSFKGFAKINYAQFLGQKKRITIVIPILVVNRNSKESPSINLEASLNAIGALYSTVPYNNIKDAGKDFLSRNYQFYNKNKKSMQAYEDTVYFPPHTVVLDKINRTNKK